ncbi:MAG: tetratricopeptide repeat protein [Myxococcota bacterium]|nr:tetratricopeptide repeat protein [Myxococcota bacterium]
MGEDRSALASVWAVVLPLGWAAAVGCAHTPTVTPLVGDPARPPSEAQVTRAWEDASEVFARHDAAGAWDGEACRESLAAFEAIRTGDGAQDARAVYMSGLVAERCGNEDGARRLYERSVELDPELCEPRTALAARLMERGRSVEARAALEAAIARNARCAPAYLNLAVLQSEDPDQREAAIDSLRRALASRSDYLPALNQMALVYLAMSEARPELLDLAAVVCRQAQLVDDAYAPIYNTWALIDVARGDVTAAVAKLARARALDPSLFEAHMNFGQLTLSQRAYEDAARAFGEARALRPESYDAAVGLGVALRGLRRPDEAEASYRAALEIDAARAEAWFDLAVLYHEHRDGTVEQLRQAEAYLEEFVRRARGVGRPSQTLERTLEETLRWCHDPPARRRRVTCHRGRAQSLHDALVLHGAREDAERPAYTR